MTLGQPRLFSMHRQETRISFLVSTLGRTTQLERLLRSLANQDYTGFDVIIVDQHQDDRLHFLFEQDWPFQLKWLRTPTERGLSRGRNTGWQASTAEFIAFPDDDCWYPPWFLDRALNIMHASGSDILTGRAADESGRDINGRYSQTAHQVDRINVWISGIEWVMRFRRAALLAVNGFDESVGVGVSTPWQACEGQDIILRALETGLICYFDPAFFGHHEELRILAPDGLTRAKGRSYGRGLGHVLRMHNYGNLSIAFWVARPVARCAWLFFRGDFRSSYYFFNVAFGRFDLSPGPS
jgi:glycosyltransferase involved in cell wall biosynthesis